MLLDVPANGIGPTFGQMRIGMKNQHPGRARGGDPARDLFTASFRGGDECGPQGLCDDFDLVFGTAIRQHQLGDQAIRHTGQKRIAGFRQQMRSVECGDDDGNNWRAWVQWLGTASI